MIWFFFRLRVAPITKHCVTNILVINVTRIFPFNVCLMRVYFSLIYILRVYRNYDTSVITEFNCKEWVTRWVSEVEHKLVTLPNQMSSLGFWVRWCFIFLCFRCYILLSFCVCLSSFIFCTITLVSSRCYSF